ncbi:hypothetical protein JCM19238_2795 [Vibrio ponticus]|nr:hypothetical protein JCM19238_2795 [Vibrio ponticus]
MVLTCCFIALGPLPLVVAVYLQLWLMRIFPSGLLRLH